VAMSAMFLTGDKVFSGMAVATMLVVASAVIGINEDAMDTAAASYTRFGLDCVMPGH